MDLHPSHVGVSIALKHLLTLRPVPTYLSDVFTCLVPALADDALPFSTHEDLLHHLDAAEGGETLAAAVEMTLGTIRKEGADALMTFVYDFRRLIGDRPTPLPPSSAIDGATDGTMIDRRSPIGIFVRRMALAFHKLPYHGVLALVRDLIRWTGGEDGAEMRLDDDQRVEVGMPPDARWRAEAMADDDALPLRLDAYERYIPSLLF